MTTTQLEAGAQAQGRRALFGWSPPDLPDRGNLVVDRLAAPVLFEFGRSMARGTNAVGRGTGTKRGTGAAGCGPGAAACGAGAFPGLLAS